MLFLLSTKTNSVSFLTDITGTPIGAKNIRLGDDKFLDVQTRSIITRDRAQNLVANGVDAGQLDGSASSSSSPPPLMAPQTPTSTPLTQRLTNLFRTP